MNLETPPAPPLIQPEARPSGGLSSPTTNGEPQAKSPSVARTPSRLPRVRHWSKQRKIVMLTSLGLVLGALVLVGVLWWTGALAIRPPFNGPTATVHSEQLKVTIVARGNLESAKNGDIVCTVRSGTKGGTNATTIKWLIEPNGIEVKKGEKVIELDDS